MLGFGDQLLTLTSAPANIVHPELQIGMLRFEVKELPEPIWLDKQYVIDQKLVIPAGFSAGSKILTWWRWDRRPKHEDPNELLRLPMAIDLFLLDHPKDFTRFQRFIETLRLLDTQAQQFLARHQEDLGSILDSAASRTHVLQTIAYLREEPLPEQGVNYSKNNRVNLLDDAAKTYPLPLVAMRNHPDIPQQLLDLDPASRSKVFRLFCHAEDPAAGVVGLVEFLQNLAEVTDNNELQALCRDLQQPQQLQKAMNGLWEWLLAYQG